MHTLPIERLLGAIGDARLVLLGEASHGTHEFYRIRAELTQALIRERGFTLAGEFLVKVKAPTLLIVGGADDVVIELNREAMRHMRCPGALEQVVRFWCRRHLVKETS